MAKSHNEHKSGAEGGSARNVADYNSFCEGDTEPHLCKKIHSLVYKQKEFIVYLDEELYVEWAYAENDEEGDAELAKFLKSKEAGEALNRVQELQALPIGHLHREQQQAYRMLIGEAVARVLQENAAASRQALEKAHQLLLARNAEMSRWWYLRACIITAGSITLLVAILWYFRDGVTPRLTTPVFQMVMNAGAGAMGALLSVLLSTRVASSEAASSEYIHNFLGAAKILAGTLGAVVIGLALRSGLLGASLVTASTNPELVWLFCMIAGTSERFVPNFIERIESTTLSGKRQS
jgi:hypothetical protein